MSKTDRVPSPAPGFPVQPRTRKEPRVVVVADADDVARGRYCQMLASHGWTVHEAADGRDALVQVYRVRPHSVVLDDRLPYIDGPELCGLLRDDNLTGSLRIVAVVSDGSHDAMRRFRELGADEVFLKPVAIDLLASALRASEDTQAKARAGDAGTVGTAPSASSRPVAKVRAHGRYVSTAPPQPPPKLRCPHCDTMLQYDCSHVGGVSAIHSEQWDYFSCGKHGEFQYRHRTRKLRAATA